MNCFRAHIISRDPLSILSGMLSVINGIMHSTRKTRFMQGYEKITGRVFGVSYPVARVFCVVSGCCYGVFMGSIYGVALWLFGWFFGLAM